MSDARHITAARDVFAAIGATDVTERQLYALADALEDSCRRGVSRLGFAISGELLGAGLNEQLMAHKVMGTKP